MTIAVDLGRKATKQTKQTNKQENYTIIDKIQPSVSRNKIKETLVFNEGGSTLIFHKNIGLNRLDLAVLFTPSTLNRQNRNQVRWNICAGVRQSTPSSEVV